MAEGRRKHSNDVTQLPTTSADVVQALFEDGVNTKDQAISHIRPSLH